MKWLKGTAALLVIVFAVAAVVPFFVTLNDYIPALEKEITARIGEPVSIDNRHAAILPMPQARADGITIGTAEEIQAASSRSSRISGRCCAPTKSSAVSSSRT